MTSELIETTAVSEPSREKLTAELTATRRALALQAAHSLRVKARYDAAQTTRDNSLHWAHADSLSAISANSPGVRQRLRDRARYEFANNTYCAGMCRTFANDVIGTGPRLQMQSGDREADSEVEMAFWKWSVATRFSDKLRTMRMAQTRDGEAFGVYVTNYSLRNKVQLDIRLYEAEQFAAPYDSSDPLGTDGIILNEYGNPIAYNLLHEHPGSTNRTQLTLDSEILRARDVLHLFRCERPGQVRGVPEVTAALPLYAQLRRYTLAVIAAAETVANIAGVISTQSPVNDPEELTPMDVVDLERGTFTSMPRGWSIEQLKAEQPCTNYQMFKREIINEIARVLGMPYNVAAGDSSSYNYSSGRLDHKTYYKLIRVDRSQYEIDALDPTLALWWEEASKVGVLPSGMRGLREPPKHTWGWDGDEHIDPLKEATAQEKRLATGTSTYADEFGATGQDWEDQFEQQAREMKKRQELGLPMPQPAAQQPIDEAMARRVAGLVLRALT